MNKTVLSRESILAFQTWLSGRGRSDLTSRAYGTDLRIFLEELEVESITREEYEETAMNWLQSNRKRIAPKTTTRRLTSLKCFAAWAGWGQVLADYSAPFVPKGIPHPLPEGIEGVFRLIEASRHENRKALVALCGLCGCRIAEALAVKPSDFDLGNMLLTIRGKGDKTRVIPISTRAWEVLQMPVTRAFCSGGGEVVGLKDRFARRIITNLGVKAGLRRSIASHDLRATFATAVFDQTKDIRLVQELLGHASVETTQLYTGVLMDNLRKAVEL